MENHVNQLMGLVLVVLSDIFHHFVLIVVLTECSVLVVSCNAIVIMELFVIKKMEHVRHQTKVQVVVMLVGLGKIVKANVNQVYLDLIVFKHVVIAGLMKIVMCILVYVQTDVNGPGQASFVQKECFVSQIHVVTRVNVNN